MIQTLQRRFILTAMIAIAVFVLVLLSVINIANAFSTYRQNVDILNELCENAAGQNAAALSEGLPEDRDIPA